MVTAHAPLARPETSIDAAGPLSHEEAREYRARLSRQTISDSGVEWLK